MNCRRFQKRLYEYVDGTLSPGTLAAANEHLARCSACREAVRRELQLAQSLSDRLRQDAESRALRPDVQRRILTALEHESVPATDEEFVGGLWNRFAWPLAMAASLLLIVAFLLRNDFPGARIHQGEVVRSDGRGIRSAVSIEVSYCAPIHRFHQEGNLVVDTLSCQTVVANGTLWTGGQKPVQQTQEKRIPL